MNEQIGDSSTTNDNLLDSSESGFGNAADQANQANAEGQAADMAQVTAQNQYQRTTTILTKSQAAGGFFGLLAPVLLLYKAMPTGPEGWRQLGEKIRKMIPFGDTVVSLIKKARSTSSFVQAYKEFKTNPAASIRGMAHAVIENTPLDDQTKSMLHVLTDSGMKLPNGKLPIMQTGEDQLKRLAGHMIASTLEPTDRNAQKQLKVILDPSKDVSMYERQVSASAYLTQKAAEHANVDPALVADLQRKVQFVRELAELKPDFEDLSAQVSERSNNLLSFYADNPSKAIAAFLVAKDAASKLYTSQPEDQVKYALYMMGGDKPKGDDFTVPPEIDYMRKVLLGQADPTLNLHDPLNYPHLTENQKEVMDKSLDLMRKINNPDDLLTAAQGELLAQVSKDPTARAILDFSKKVSNGDPDGEPLDRVMSAIEDTATAEVKSSYTRITDKLNPAQKKLLQDSIDSMSKTKDASGLRDLVTEHLKSEYPEAAKALTAYKNVKEKGKIEPSDLKGLVDALPVDDKIKGIAKSVLDVREFKFPSAKTLMEEGSKRLIDEIPDEKAKQELRHAMDTAKTSSDVEDFASKLFEHYTKQKVPDIHEMMERVRSKGGENPWKESADTLKPKIDKAPLLNDDQKSQLKAAVDIRDAIKNAKSQDLLKELSKKALDHLPPEIKDHQDEFLDALDTAKSSEDVTGFARAMIAKHPALQQRLSDMEASGSEIPDLSKLTTDDLKKFVKETNTLTDDEKSKINNFLNIAEGAKDMSFQKMDPKEIGTAVLKVLKNKLAESDDPRMQAAAVAIDGVQRWVEFAKKHEESSWTDELKKAGTKFAKDTFDDVHVASRSLAEGFWGGKFQQDRGATVEKYLARPGEKLLEYKYQENRENRAKRFKTIDETDLDTPRTMTADGTEFTAKGNPLDYANMQEALKSQGLPELPLVAREDIDKTKKALEGDAEKRDAEGARPSDADEMDTSGAAESLSKRLTIDRSGNRPSEIREKPRIRGWTPIEEDQPTEKNLRKKALPQEDDENGRRTLLRRVIIAPKEKESDAIQMTDLRESGIDEEEEKDSTHPTYEDTLQRTMLALGDPTKGTKVGGYDVDYGKEEDKTPLVSEEPLDKKGLLQKMKEKGGETVEGLKTGVEKVAGAIKDRIVKALQPKESDFKGTPLPRTEDRGRYTAYFSPARDVGSTMHDRAIEERNRSVDIGKTIVKASEEMVKKKPTPQNADDKEIAEKNIARLKAAKEAASEHMQKTHENEVSDYSGVQKIRNNEARYSTSHDEAYDISHGVHVIGSDVHNHPLVRNELSAMQRLSDKKQVLSESDQKAHVDHVNEMRSINDGLIKASRETKQVTSEDGKTKQVPKYPVSEESTEPMTMDQASTQLAVKPLPKPALPIMSDTTAPTIQMKDTPTAISTTDSDAMSSAQSTATTLNKPQPILNEPSTGVPAPSMDVSTVDYGNDDAL